MFKRSCRTAILAGAAVFALLALQACPGQSDSGDGGTAAVKLPAGSASKRAGADNPAASAERAQKLILLYTGDTLSTPEPDRSLTPPEGGLPALANAIMSYENELLDAARARVSGAGGDPATVKSQRSSGIFGEDPFILLDYGGWERPDDHYGTMFVQLFFKYAAAMNYTNLAALRFETLSLDRWNDYQHLDGYPNFLASTAHRLVPGIGPLRIRELDYLGAHWGLVSIPELTAEDAKAADGRVWKADIEEAAGYLKEKNCQASVLIAAGLPAAAYAALKSDPRFTVVIGVPAAQATAPGAGSLDGSGPLLLPSLLPGGRQLGICHLTVGEKSRIPTDYAFELRQVTDDESQAYPFRKQCEEQVLKHAEWTSRDK